jgi:hypothetical protein
MQVIVKANHTTSLAIAAVALNHFATQWKPLAAVRFDKEATFVFEHGRFNDLHIFNDG